MYHVLLGRSKHLIVMQFDNYTFTPGCCQGSGGQCQCRQNSYTVYIPVYAFLPESRVEEHI